MTGTGAVLLIGGGLGVLVALVASAASSLRTFSRSRLESVCRDAGQPELFGTILARRERVQVAADILHLVVLAGTAVTASWWITAASPAWNSWSLYVVLATMGVAVLLAEIIVPWSSSRVWGDQFLVRNWWWLHGTSVVMRPLLAVVLRIDRLCHRMAGRDEPQVDDLSALTAEIRSVMDEGQRGGLIEAAARTMIHRVMEWHDEDVAAVMTPRTDMICLSADASLEDARQQLLDAGHTRVPVVGTSTDDIVGVLYAKDLLGHLQVDNVSAPGGLREIIREPFYVPETTGIDTLLETLKHEQVHLAIVLDEYGGVAGLVTLEDVLEEIVGEIEDEYDVGGGDLVKTIGTGLVEIDARAHIDDLNERMGYGLPEDEDYDTLGGWVITRLGRIPELGECLNWGQWEFRVDAADKRRVRRVRVQTQSPGETVDPDATEFDEPAADQVAEADSSEPAA